MPKNIVICCDGTGNQFGEANSNVVKLYAVLRRESPDQVVYYDPGVGTMSDPGLNIPFGKLLSIPLGLIFGYGLNKNIAEAYTFLMDNYEKGDKVFLFGFSRGAYTVRVLAGFLHLNGLLYRGCQNLIPYSWRLFSSNRRRKRFELSARFRKNYAREIPIHFVGVWDTVSSIGWITLRKTFPFTANNRSVENARHAIAIDERRAYYETNPWGTNPEIPTNVKEVWFAGVHSDVGGSYPEQESGLAKITLKWMIDEARPFDLKIDEERYKRVVLGINARGDYVGPDFRGPVHRSLKYGWWILEFLPKNDTLKRWKYRFPLGRRRVIPEDALIHQSVLDKIQDGKYKPKNLPKQYRVEPGT